MNYSLRLVTLVLVLISFDSACVLLKAGTATPASSIQSGSTSSDTESVKEEIRRVIKDSQFNETLLIYVFPSTFNKNILSEFWVPENKGGQAIVKVENSIRRLLTKRWHYDQESKNEQFEILSITVFKPGDVAEVRTKERWYVPMMDERGWLVKEIPSTLEYSATYRLIKIEKTWLILLTTVPYREGA